MINKSKNTINRNKLLTDLASTPLNALAIGAVNLNPSDYIVEIIQIKPDQNKDG